MREEERVDPEVAIQLDAARELLGMELAYLAEFRGGHLVYRAVSGDPAPFDVEPGASVLLDHSCCSAVVESGLPTAIEDTGRLRGVRSYVCVPVRLSDGRLYGSLCSVSEERAELLGQRDLRMMEVLGRLVGERLEGDNGKREIEAAGVRAFLAALDARDSYTGKHTDAVLDLALDVAEELGVERDEAREVGQVALLHDLGKIGVPDSILKKPGPLTDHEWTVMRTHPGVGAEMVSSVAGLDHLAPAVRAEHERWDGRGYPDGLRGDQIPLSSRIVFACDAFHAMTSDRPYRPALERDRALDELERGGGSQFCPDTVDVLLSRVAPVAGPAPAAA